MSDSDHQLAICWTTTSTLEQARELAAAALQAGLASCVQIDGQIESHYMWEDKPQHDIERRVWFKTPSALEPQLSELVLKQHPYDCPQWVSVQADKVDENYLKWAEEVSNLHGFH